MKLIKEFIFKHEMVEYVEDYYSDTGDALSDEESEILAAAYVPTPSEDEEYNIVLEIRDITIWRLSSGRWLIERDA